jgi:hypothetical protein
VASSCPELGVRTAAAVQDHWAQGCTKLEKPDQNALGGALVAGALSSVVVAFFGGCVYALVLGLGRHSSDGASSIMVVPEIGFLAALVALPVTFALTFAVSLPLFRLWIRRGYTTVAMYVGGGLVPALVGASILTAAHIFDDFMVDSTFLFAVALMGVSGPVAGFVVWYVLQRSTQQRAHVDGH